MERETLQRALHLWPEWDDSIEKSREELGYDPTWPVEEAMIWLEERYAHLIRPRAEAELRRLKLPLNLRTYWEDCFYCGYRRPDGSADFSKIRRARASRERDRQGNFTGRWVENNPSLPELPFEVAIVSYPEEDIWDPWVRLEVMIHGPLARRDLLEDAMEQAWITLDHRSLVNPELAYHPLLELIPQARANRSEVKRDALERYQRGEVDFEGLLVEQMRSRDIQEKWRALQQKYGQNPARLKRRKQDLEKQVYDVVRSWFPDPKPSLPVKGRWRRIWDGSWDQ